MKRVCYRNLTLLSFAYLATVLFDSFELYKPYAEDKGFEPLIHSCMPR